jgi:hypothetical protein
MNVHSERMRKGKMGQKMGAEEMDGIVVYNDSCWMGK